MQSIYAHSESLNYSTLELMLLLCVCVCMCVCVKVEGIVYILLVDIQIYEMRGFIHVTGLGCQYHKLSEISCYTDLQ